jgi:hypothetical protein
MNTSVQNYTVALSTLMMMLLLKTDDVGDKQLAPALVKLKDYELELLNHHDVETRAAANQYVHVNRKLICLAISQREYCASSVFGDLLTIKAEMSAEQASVVQASIDHVMETKCTVSMFIATMYQDVLQTWYDDIMMAFVSTMKTVEA